MQKVSSLFGELGPNEFEVFLMEFTFQVRENFIIIKGAKLAN